MPPHFSLWEKLCGGSFVERGWQRNEERGGEKERERYTHTHRIIIKLPADNLVHS